MLHVFLVALGMAAGAGLLAVLGVVSSRGYQFAGSAAVVAGACLLTFVHAIAIDRGRLVGWMRAAIVASWLGAATWLVLIWSDAALGPAWWERVARLAGGLTLAGVAGALVGLAFLSRAGGASVVAVRWTAFALAVFWAAFGELALAFPDFVDDYVIQALFGREWFGRIAIASMIVGTTALLAQPVLLRLGQLATQDGGGALRGRRTRVRMTCPRCGCGCEIEANTAAACPACRLELRVEVDEPRCACGYLLFALEADACPECGAPVPASKRWGGATVRP
jgi:hypothetical protein